MHRVLLMMSVVMALVLPATAEASPAPGCTGVAAPASSCSFTYTGGDIVIWARATAVHPVPDAYWGSHGAVYAGASVLGICAARSTDACYQLVEDPPIAEGTVLRCSGSLWNDTNEGRPVGATSFGCVPAA